MNFLSFWQDGFWQDVWRWIKSEYFFIYAILLNRNQCSGKWNYCSIIIFTTISLVEKRLKEKRPFVFGDFMERIYNFLSYFLKTFSNTGEKKLKQKIIQGYFIIIMTQLFFNPHKQPSPSRPTVQIHWIVINRN